MREKRFFSLLRGLVLAIPLCLVFILSVENAVCAQTSEAQGTQGVFDAEQSAEMEKGRKDQSRFGRFERCCRFIL